jgi:hypothetical protein
MAGTITTSVSSTSTSAEAKAMSATGGGVFGFDGIGKPISADQKRLTSSKHEGVDYWRETGNSPAARSTQSLASGEGSASESQVGKLGRLTGEVYAQSASNQPTAFMDVAAEAAQRNPAALRSENESLKKQLNDSNAKIDSLEQKIADLTAAVERLAGAQPQQTPTANTGQPPPPPHPAPAANSQHNYNPGAPQIGPAGQTGDHGGGGPLGGLISMMSKIGGAVSGGSISMFSKAGQQMFTPQAIDKSYENISRWFGVPIPAQHVQHQTPFVPQHAQPGQPHPQAQHGAQAWMPHNTFPMQYQYHNPIGLHPQTGPGSYGYPQQFMTPNPIPVMPGTINVRDLP